MKIRLSLAAVFLIFLSPPPAFSQNAPFKRELVRLLSDRIVVNAISERGKKLAVKIRRDLLNLPNQTLGEFAGYLDAAGIETLELSSVTRGSNVHSLAVDTFVFENRDGTCLQSIDGIMVHLKALAVLQPRYKMAGIEIDPWAEACNPKHKRAYQLLTDHSSTVVRNLEKIALYGDRKGKIETLTLWDEFDVIFGKHLTIDATDPTMIEEALVKGLFRDLPLKTNSKVTSKAYFARDIDGNGQSIRVEARWLDKEEGIYLVYIENQNETINALRHFGYIAFPKSLFDRSDLKQLSGPYYEKIDALTGTPREKIPFYLTTAGHTLTIWGITLPNARNPHPRRARVQLNVDEGLEHIIEIAKPNDPASPEVIVGE